MIKTGILTISDKGSKGEREDLTGPAIEHKLKEDGYSIEYYKVIPDDLEKIKEELIHMCDNLKLNLIFTNGGTGFSKRDVTPEATMAIIERYVPGIGEAMRMESLKITPKAMLSRAISGIRGETLIVNLPGSPKASIENLEVIMPVLPHGIDILTGVDGECAR
ncbi:MogA/MoaB family molybdenum cofactor biosynthesis protein [uncultured Clostridium sp.]|uniref:MogA/MoaB family molybdenum cofactor biosynthesis protein n=1 Tax=uncultured Clostridium sp. TaxID=59620 RepID=UPI0028F00856|nr:MogA/MoaB family molybdenum cofactor biosynthesis protein [uncultured Clostridium sp.]